MAFAQSEALVKPPLIFLCHRIPYPPNKGDKIRAYHLLRYLCEHYQVHLGAFVDDPADWVYAKKLEDMCEEVYLVKLNPKIARLKSAWGLFNKQPLSLPYYASIQMRHWVSRVFEKKNIDRVVVYSSVMARYLMGEKYSDCQKIADMVDVDSEKWREYSHQKRFPMSWVYRREADSLLKFEKKVALTFNHSLFVSTAEADKFKQLAPEAIDRVGSYSNGVNSEYFCPEGVYTSPYKEGQKALVFTGAMDYWPNIDAVSWFAREVFPAIYNENSEARFYIVGSKPVAQVIKLAELPGVVVTGWVEDVRPYLRHAELAVVPMRIARGIQNKVLEAMAMGLIVIVSEPGLEGITAEHGREILVAKQQEDYAVFVKDVFAEKYGNMGQFARGLVKRSFNWANTLPLVGHLLEGGAL